LIVGFQQLVGFAFPLSVSEVGLGPASSSNLANSPSPSPTSLTLVGDEIRLEAVNPTATVSGISSVTLLMANVPEFTIINESVEPLPPRVLVAEEEIKINRMGESFGEVYSNTKVRFLKGNNKTLTGNVISVGDVEIADKNIIDGNVTAGGAVENDGTVTGVITPNAGVGPITLPTVADIVPGSNDVTVPANEARSLAPGGYRHVRVRENASLSLSNGVYNLAQLTLDKNARLFCDVGDGPVTINVKSQISFNANAQMHVVNDASGQPSTQVTVNTNFTGTIKFRDRSVVLGTVNAPEAWVVFQEKAFFQGALFARRIETGKNAAFAHHTAPAAVAAARAAAEEVEDEEVNSEQSSVISYELAQNYPNPFNPTTVIRFQLPADGEVSLVIYNANGQLVRRLARGQYASGKHEVAWDGKNEHGVAAASGSYFYRINVQGLNGGVVFSESRRMTLVK